LLVAIFDPNRAVEPRYLNYVVATKSGLVVTGILASETSTGLTILSADGKKHDLLRSDVDELAATGKSLMPEGMERDLPPQDVADLFSFLQRQWSSTVPATK
jgi:putative heme-binding domain-containing protein